MAACNQYTGSPFSIGLKCLKTHINIKISAHNYASAHHFKRLELINKKEDRRGGAKFRKGFLKTEMLPPRYKQMPVNQSWMSVWPTAQSFRPSVVPLPLHQGYTEKGKAPPGKFANAELMKVPNFLHLTPPAIEAHCAAIKKFCTPWPAELKSDADCEAYFPLEIITNDYCHSSPSIRDSKARIVTIKFKLSRLKFDYHARDKFLRLVGDQYDKDTDTVTIVTDRCPLRKQNYEYAMYVVTALYHESMTTESWESDKTEADMEAYFFDKSRSQTKISALMQTMKGLQMDEAVAEPVVDTYGQATENIYNKDESQEDINKYKQSVLELLGMQ